MQEAAGDLGISLVPRRIPQRLWNHRGARLKRPPRKEQTTSTVRSISDSSTARCAKAGVPTYWTSALDAFSGPCIDSRSIAAG
jgi:hypothetical protein